MSAVRAREKRVGKSNDWWGSGGDGGAGRARSPLAACVVRGLVLLGTGVMVGVVMLLRVPWMVAMCGGALVAERFLADIDLGLVSVRVYLMGVLLMAVCARVAVTRRRLFRSAQARLLCVAYVSFVAWAWTSRLYQGEQMADVAQAIAATHLMAISVFVVTQAALAKRRYAAALGGIMGGTAVASGAVGILQWLGVNWAWELALLLRPGERSAELLLGTLRGGTYGFVPGLASYSIPFSYHLVSFGMFAVAWVQEGIGGRRGALQRTIGLIGVIVIWVALVVSQSRSAVLAGLLAAGALVFFGGTGGRRARSAAAHAARVCGGIGLAIVLLLGMQIAWGSLAGRDLGPGEGQYSLGRILQVDDPRRAELLSAAWQLASEEWLFGAGLRRFGSMVEAPGDQYAARGPVAPHTMFLSAAVYYGLPGVFLVVAVLGTIAVTCNEAMRVAQRDPDVRWVVLGGVSGLLAYFVNAQFHNDSLVTGGTLPWWLLGVLCAVISAAREGGWPEGRRRTHLAHSAREGGVCGTDRRWVSGSAVSGRDAEHGPKVLD